MAIPFKEQVQHLTQADINDIQTQYDAAMSTAHGSGEHMTLIGLLSQKGFGVNSVLEAYEMADKIVSIWEANIFEE